MGHRACAERIEIESSRGAHAPSEASNDYAFIERKDLRTFLVACLQASVSVETMSRYLGLTEDTVREELRLGIEEWNTRSRGAAGPSGKPRLRIAASRD